MLACYSIVLALFHSSRAALIAVWLLAIDMTQLTSGAFGRMDIYTGGLMIRNIPVAGCHGIEQT
jgi:hypothetical protein